MFILCACEITGRVRDAFIRRGHTAFSCDTLGPDDVPELFERQAYPDMHITGDVRDYLKPTAELPWDMLIGFPPCTYLSNAGVRHLYSITSRGGKTAKVHGLERQVLMEQAIDFFLLLKRAPIQRIALENPIMHNHARERIGKYDQLIQPWMFGHAETKATGLWLKNLPPLKPTRVVEGRAHFVHMEPDSKGRAMRRAETFYGVAEAMANQWGVLSEPAYALPLPRGTAD